MTVTEKAWQNTVLELASYGRWLTYHPHDSRHSTPGWPDLALVRPPELVMVELKTDVGRLSSAQKLWLNALLACGVECHVWRPRDFDEVAARLAAPTREIAA